MADTKIIFVRHGEAEGNIKRIFHGFYNSSLTEDGHIQASLSAKYLHDTVYLTVSADKVVYLAKARLFVEIGAIGGKCLL